MQRAVSVHELQNTKFKTVPIEGGFKKLIGEPELTGSWMIFGGSGNGKTSFSLQLAKQLSSFKKVAYDSLEEGVSLSMQKAFKRTGMESARKKIILLDMESIEDLKVRLRRRRSPDIIFIDSIQYSGLNKKAYESLKREFRKKLFIWISHADGKKPGGRLANAVYYDSFVKIRVEGYKAHAISRYADGKTEPYTIWQQGADEYEGIIH